MPTGVVSQMLDHSRGPRLHPAPGQQIFIADDSHLYAIGFSTHDPAPINRVFGPLVVDWIAIP